MKPVTTPVKITLDVIFFLVDFEFCLIKLPANPPKIVASKKGHGNVYVKYNGFDLMELAVAVSKLFPIPSERK